MFQYKFGNRCRLRSDIKVLGKTQHFRSLYTRSLNKNENCELSDIPEQRLELFIDSGNNSRDCLEIHYINADYVQCGITTKAWDILDISEYNALMFCVKGKEGNEELTLAKIRDNLEKNVTPQLDIALYLPSASVTTEWQKVIIPFSDIPQLENISLENFKFMIFKFAPKGEHTVYLDNIMFIKHEKEEAIEEVIEETIETGTSEEILKPEAERDKLLKDSSTNVSPEPSTNIPSEEGF